MKVAFVSSEALPYAKTGGLADVIGALPQALRKLGVETRVFMPRYTGIKGAYTTSIDCDMGKKYTVKIFEEGSYTFIDYPDFYERENLYGTEKGDYPDNCERFTLFCKAVAQLVQDEGFDIVHCHDWQSALIPLYIRLAKSPIRSVFTIHNLGYQGKFPVDKFSVLGIPEHFFNPEGIEFYGAINLLKAGVLYSDVVTTVSKNYAAEIQTSEFGFGLDGVLCTRRSDLHGIINGIDYQIWNPQTDALVYNKYRTYEDKKKNKIALAEECSIKSDQPLIGMVSRMADQKGFDLISKAFESFISMGYSFVLLGFGDEAYHEKFRKYEKMYRDHVSVHLKFDNTLAHRIYAGSDFFLMPSRYEPCGLGQLISMRYGSIPIVRKTGGLADTVEDYDPTTKAGSGIVFEAYTAEALIESLARAHALYTDSDSFRSLAAYCMTLDFSWEESARKYKKLYASLLT
jgi:starch synthase